MVENRPQNVVVFSPGRSTVKGGNMETIISYFTEKKQNCISWRNLFDDTRHEKKAILQMLIKKIPTFDFAIIIGEGYDLVIKDGGVPDTSVKKKEYLSMRDNVLFECGLCIMALGSRRVILLKEEKTYLPADIRTHPELSDLGLTSLKMVEFSNEKKNLEEMLEQVYDYINKEKTELSPVVVGAAISTADGYFSNFVLRFWENTSKGFEELLPGNKTIKRSFPSELKDIKMEICVPGHLDDKVKGRIRSYYARNQYRQGFIRAGEIRGVDFYFKDEGGKFTVCDIPSTVTASYSTVKDILNIDADEKNTVDTVAENRFVMKELDTFIFTLRKLMKAKSVFAKLKDVPIYKTDGETDKTKIDRIQEILDSQVKIIEIDLAGY